MKTKLTLLLLCGIFFTSTKMNAQQYKSAIGAKLGYGLVGSYKTFLNESSAIDLFAGFRGFGSGLAAGAYYEKHKPIASTAGLQWYWGFGGSLTTWSYGSGLGGYYEVGASGVLGLDYAFKDIPLNVSVDWAPTIVLLDSWDFNGTYNRFRGGYGALTARYILNSSK
jgi:hypothetical protein